MRLSISAVGMATAQGGCSQVLGGDDLRTPQALPWASAVNEWTSSTVCHPAVGIDSTLTGIPRWRAVVKMALADCFGDQLPAPETPIFVASCNGAAAGFDLTSWSKAFDSTALLAGTPWSGRRLPVFSSSCNSGLQALYAATQALNAGCANEAVVLGADILSESNQNNFASLRVLADSPLAPWQQNTTGFILGEAAVALKITRAEGDGLACLSGPVLTNELREVDGLRRVLEEMSGAKPTLILGQGTGPKARDELELAALQTAIDQAVPIATPLVHFGHTLGASGLLAVALAFLTKQNRRILPVLTMPDEFACDGRPLVNGVNGPDGLARSECILITCGALDGSCAAATVGNIDRNIVRDKETPEQYTTRGNSWKQQTASGPLMHPTLRRLAAEALAHRPQRPPDVLVVRLHEPLAPPREAWFGERLLPSAVLEMTPGFVPQLIARSWGFAGPALCMVGNTDGVENDWDLLAVCKTQGLTVAQIDVPGTGENREIIWHT